MEVSDNVYYVKPKQDELNLLFKKLETLEINQLYTIKSYVENLINIKNINH
jgi:hypothetical protein